MHEPTSDALIATRSLTKTYATSEAAEVYALRDVDLDVREGELTVLMGSSGSGKSTLLYLLSGLEEASAGEIHFAGERVDRMDETELSLLRRRGIGFVFQAIHLVPHLTLAENVIVPGYLVDRDREAVRERAQALLDRLGVGALADRLPAQVTGGEQQLAAIARALINSPRAVLADEPTGALNSAAGAAVLEAFRDLNAGGQTLLMATHEVRAACCGDRVVYLRDGSVIAELELDGSEDEAKREGRLLEWLSDQGW
ncbi:MAG: ABC transporter ATP-binding protein [Thermoanaerobaculia bacterium]|nr:ABC transporter ATP-binding protein [Thermoanaerobaculia bacterium]